METGIISLSSLILWKWETCTGSQILGNLLDACQAAMTQMFTPKQQLSFTSYADTYAFGLDRDDAMLQAMVFKPEICKAFSFFFGFYCFHLCDPSQQVEENNGDGNERLLVQKRDRHFSQPAKWQCWRDTKHRLSFNRCDRPSCQKFHRVELKDTGGGPGGEETARQICLQPSVKTASQLCTPSRHLPAHLHSHQQAEAHRVIPSGQWSLIRNRQQLASKAISPQLTCAEASNPHFGAYSDSSNVFLCVCIQGSEELLLSDRPIIQWRQ